MARPVFAGSSFSRQDSSAIPTVQVTPPTHDSGDLLVMMAYYSRSSTSVGAYTTPTGWTAGVTETTDSLLGGPGIRCSIFYRFGTGTAGQFSMTAPANGRHHVYISRWTGTAATLSAAIHAESTVQGLNQTVTATAPDLAITDGDNSAVIWGACFQDNTPTETQFQENTNFSGTLRGFTSWESSPGSNFAVTNGYSTGTPDSDTQSGDCTFFNENDFEANVVVTVVVAGASDVVLRTDSTLSSVTVGTMAVDSFNFDAGTLSYALSVPNSMASIRLTPTATDGATITLNGTAVTSGSLSPAVSLTSNGDTTITLVATAEDGNSTTTYTFTVSRAASSDASLSALVPSVGAFEPVFSTGRHHYFKSLSASSIRITPTTSSSAATMTVGGFALASGVQSGQFNLTAGVLFSLDIVVVAEDGVTTETYQIHTLRELSTSSNNYLFDVTVSATNLKPEFSPLTMAFRGSVASSQQAITVTPSASHGDATIRVDGTAVTSGSASGAVALTDNALTAIPVVVTAENSVTRTYTLNITRGKIPSEDGDRSALVRGLSRALTREI